MNASVELLELYDQWKQLTEREGAGILASDWAEVHRCQKSKQELQPEIIKVSDQVKKASQQSGGFEPRLRERINALIQLETSNSANLETRLESTRQERESLDRTSQRLRQIHKSYIPSQAAVWNGRA
jgi:predicted RNase H-like nuclease (RuvC/YqgF family)